MTRFALALAASLALTVAARAADLPAGTWAANVDGNKGDLVIKEVKDEKVVTGSLLGVEVRGRVEGPPAHAQADVRQGSGRHRAACPTAQGAHDVDPRRRAVLPGQVRAEAGGGAEVAGRGGSGGRGRGVALPR